MYRIVVNLTKIILPITYASVMFKKSLSIYKQKIMTEVFIYSLEDPETKEIRYIGKTVQKLEKRLTAHIYESKHRKNHKCNWINKLNKNGNNPTIKLIDIVSEDDWEFWEMYWIERFKSWGFNLVNHTPGGEGYRHSKETKEKIRQANSGENHYFYGKKHKKISKEKISDSLIGNKYAKGFKHSEKTKEKVGAKTREYYKKNPRTKEHNKKIGDSNSRAKAKPIYQYDTNRNLIRKFNSVRSAVTELGFGRDGIYDCAKGNQKLYKGFIWSWS